MQGHSSPKAEVRVQMGHSLATGIIRNTWWVFLARCPSDNTQLLKSMATSVTLPRLQMRRLGTLSQAWDMHPSCWVFLSSHNTSCKGPLGPSSSMVLGGRQTGSLGFRPTQTHLALPAKEGIQALITWTTATKATLENATVWLC